MSSPSTTLSTKKRRRIRILEDSDEDSYESASAIEDDDVEIPRKERTTARSVSSHATQVPKLLKNSKPGKNNCSSIGQTARRRRPSTLATSSSSTTESSDSDSDSNVSTSILHKMASKKNPLKLNSWNIKRESPLRKGRQKPKIHCKEDKFSSGFESNSDSGSSIEVTPAKVSRQRRKKKLTIHCKEDNLSSGFESNSESSIEVTPAKAIRQRRKKKLSTSERNKQHGIDPTFIHSEEGDSSGGDSNFVVSPTPRLNIETRPSSAKKKRESAEGVSSDASQQSKNIHLQSPIQRKPPAQPKPQKHTSQPTYLNRNPPVQPPRAIPSRMAEQSSPSSRHSFASPSANYHLSSSDESEQLEAVARKCARLKAVKASPADSFALLLSDVGSATNKFNQKIGGSASRSCDIDIDSSSSSDESTEMLRPFKTKKKFPPSLQSWTTNPKESIGDPSFGEKAETYSIGDEKNHLPEDTDEIEETCSRFERKLADPSTKIQKSPATAWHPGMLSRDNIPESNSEILENDANRKSEMDELILPQCDSSSSSSSLESTTDDREQSPCRNSLSVPANIAVIKTSEHLSNAKSSPSFAANNPTNNKFINSSPSPYNPYARLSTSLEKGPTKSTTTRAHLPPEPSVESLVAEAASPKYHQSHEDLSNNRTGQNTEDLEAVFYDDGILPKRSHQTEPSITIRNNSSSHLAHHHRPVHPSQQSHERERFFHQPSSHTNNIKALEHEAFFDDEKKVPRASAKPPELVDLCQDEDDDIIHAAPAPIIHQGLHVEGRSPQFNQRSRELRPVKQSSTFHEDIGYFTDDDDVCGFSHPRQRRLSDVSNTRRSTITPKEWSGQQARRQKFRDASNSALFFNHSFGNPVPMQPQSYMSTSGVSRGPILSTDNESVFYRRASGSNMSSFERQQQATNVPPRNDLIGGSGVGAGSYSLQCANDTYAEDMEEYRASIKSGRGRGRGRSAAATNRSKRQSSGRSKSGKTAKRGRWGWKRGRGGSKYNKRGGGVSRSTSNRGNRGSGQAHVLEAYNDPNLSHVGSNLHL